MKIAINSELGKGIVETYNYIESQEGNYNLFPRTVAEQIINKVKRVIEQAEKKDGLLVEEFKRLEDKFSQKGTFHAIDTNLGVRTALHVMIELNNLFNEQTGWVLADNDTRQHKIVDSKTYCGLTIVADHKPHYSYMDSWPVCQDCLDGEKAFRSKSN